MLDKSLRMPLMSAHINFEMQVKTDESIEFIKDIEDKRPQ